MKKAPTLNISDLVAVLEGKIGLPSVTAQWVMRELVSTIRTQLRRGDVVKLRNLGTLSVRRRKKRKIRCIETGKEISLPSQRYVHWSSSMSLKKDFNP